MAESSSKVGELVGEISAASNEQAQGIEQVNIAKAEDVAMCIKKDTLHEER